MSATAKPSPLPALQSSVATRWLLPCHFDYRQRTWHLPEAHFVRTNETHEPGIRAAVRRLAALSAINSLWRTADRQRKKKRAFRQPRNGNATDFIPA